MSIQLNVEVQEAQMILGALAKLPLEQSADTFFKIRSQAEQQIAAQQQDAAPAAPATPAAPAAPAAKPSGAGDAPSA
jgi:hypothetical protein